MRLIIVVMGCLFLASGCASTQAGSNSGSEQDRPAYISVAEPEDYSTNGFWPSMFRIVRIDGQDFRQTIRLPPGKHIITVQVDWSNYYEDETDLPINAVADGYYKIFALEVESGQENNVIIQPISMGKRMARDMMGVALAPVLYLGMGYSIIKMFGNPKSRPPARGCFVWIENGKTGQVVSGTRPDGIAIHGQPEAPAEPLPADR